MKKSSYLVTGAFLLIIGGISLGTLLADDRDFSPNENRYLSQVPQLSWSNVMNGKYQEDLENYLNDQIVGRDQWITVKTGIQKATGDTDIGGAYLGKDGYDFEKITPDDLDEKLINRNLKSVKTFMEDNSAKLGKEHVHFLLVPTSGLVLQDKLPKNAILFDQEKYIDQAVEEIGKEQLIDVRPVLCAAALSVKEDSDNIYYRTDHHWTTYGAFLAAQQWNGARGIRLEKEENYKQIKVTDEFRGSLYSKILNHDSAYDTIYRWDKKPEYDGNEQMNQKGEANKDSDLKQDQAFQVFADGKDIGGFYQKEKLKEKDKYAYFFGGNYGEVFITYLGDEGRKETGSEDAQSEINGTVTKDTSTQTVVSDGNRRQSRNLLVVKDSFANTFVPLIARQYDQICMVDFRYFNQSLKEYMEEKKITDVLILYNISNFVKDKDIFKIEK